jgi:hypothetical protein
MRRINRRETLTKAAIASVLNEDVKKLVSKCAARILSLLIVNVRDRADDIASPVGIL